MQNLGENGMTLPHEPRIRVYGVDANSCFVFKSTVQPMKLGFQARVFPEGWTDDHELPPLTPYGLVFKNGDDMR